MDQLITISTVTPVYNGSKYLPALVEELSRYKRHLEEKQDIIRLQESVFVVDEAIDNSLEILIGLKEKYPFINVIELSRNFGQHPATIAGLLHTSGDMVVTLDEDLQHQPFDITELLKVLVDDTSDIVYAKTTKATHRSIVKDGAARLYKHIVASLMKNPHVKDFNSFRLIRGTIGRAAAAICRHETYLDVAFSWFTKRISTCTMTLIDQRNQSKEEVSGYSVWGLIRHGKRMLMSTKIKLLRVGITIGIFAFLFSLLFSAYTLLRKLMNFDDTLIQGWTSTILTMFFFGGLSVLLIGFILESISDLALSVNGKPTFFTIDRSNDKRLKEALNKLD